MIFFFVDENGIRYKQQNIQKLKKLGQWMEMEWVGKDKFWGSSKNWTMDENKISWQKDEIPNIFIISLRNNEE